jgi:hypothetical protein
MVARTWATDCSDCAGRERTPETKANFWVPEKMTDMKRLDLSGVGTPDRSPNQSPRIAQPFVLRSAAGAPAAMAVSRTPPSACSAAPIAPVATPAVEVEVLLQRLGTEFTELVGAELVRQLTPVRLEMARVNEEFTVQLGQFRLEMRNALDESSGMDLDMMSMGAATKEMFGELVGLRRDVTALQRSLNERMANETTVRTAPVEEKNTLTMPPAGAQIFDKISDMHEQIRNLQMSLKQHSPRPKAQGTRVDQGDSDQAAASFDMLMKMGATRSNDELTMPTFADPSLKPPGHRSIRALVCTLKETKTSEWGSTFSSILGEVFEGDNPFISLFQVLLVLANAIYLWVEQDAAMHSALSQQAVPEWIFQGDCAFTGIFTLELFIRAWVLRSKMFSQFNIGWTVCDLILTGMLWAEVVVHFFTNGANASIRIFRAARLLRVIRVLGLFRELRQLRLIGSMIGSAIMAVSWSFCFLFLFTFMFAILCMTNVSASVSANTSDLVLESVRFHYGSVLETMRQLLGCISGGVDWMTVSVVLNDVSNGYNYATDLFLIYILFVAFGLLNILTAVIVDSTNKASALDRDRILLEELARQKAFKDKLGIILLDADTDGTGTISREELDEQLKDPRVVSYMNSLGVPRSSATSVFNLLLEEQIEKQRLSPRSATKLAADVPIDTFVNALVYYHNQGDAKHVDIATLLTEFKLQRKELIALTQYLDHQFKRVIDDDSGAAYMLGSV